MRLRPCGRCTAYRGYHLPRASSTRTTIGWKSSSSVRHWTGEGWCVTLTSSRPRSAPPSQHSRAATGFDPAAGGSGHGRSPRPLVSRAPRRCDPRRRRGGAGNPRLGVADGIWRLSRSAADELRVGGEAATDTAPRVKRTEQVRVIAFGRRGRPRRGRPRAARHPRGAVRNRPGVQECGQARADSAHRPRRSRPGRRAGVTWTSRILFFR